MKNSLSLHSANATPALRVNHAAFPTRDLAAAVAFYRDVLGFKPYYVGSDDWAMLSAGDTSLSLIKAETDRRGQWQGGSHHQHLGLTVADKESVEAWHAKLKKASVGSLGKPTHHRDGSYGFYFRDRDGNPLELIFIPHRSHHLPAPDEGWLIVAETPSPLWQDLPARMQAHVPGAKVAVVYKQNLSTIGELPSRVRLFPSTSTVDVAPIAQELATRYPKTHFEMQPPLSEHPLVKDALLAALVLSGNA